MENFKKLSYEESIESISNGGLKIELEKFCFTTSYGTKYYTKTLEIHKNPIKCPGLFNRMVPYKEVKTLFKNLELDFCSLKKEFPGLTILAKNISHMGDLYQYLRPVKRSFFLFSLDKVFINATYNVYVNKFLYGFFVSGKNLI